jgi:hypothetical protein
VVRKFGITLFLMILLLGSCAAMPIAHWKMDDDAATATVVDTMGSYNGIYKDKDGNVNTEDGASTGRFDGALNFDGREILDGGTELYVDTGDTFQSTFRGSFSISMWVKPTDGRPLTSGTYLFGVSEVSETDCVWIVLANTGQLIGTYVSDGDEATYYGSDAQFEDGQIEDFHHVVLVADSEKQDIEGILMYFDGVKIPPVHPTLFRGDTSGVTFADFTTTVNPYIGAENLNGTGTNFHNGLIDDVRIYDKALTALEVRAIFCEFRYILLSL